jgi:hypothetical protein
MTKREGYSKRMDQNLSGWKQRFEARLVEARKLGDQVPRETREDLERHKVAYDDATAKLRELREAAAKWLALREQLEGMWQAMEPPAAEAPAATDAVRRRVADAG